MRKKQKFNPYKYILLIVSILFVGLVYAITIIESPSNPADGYTTSASSVLLGWNISSQGDENISDIKLNWNGINYSFMQGLVYMANFNNFSALGENSTRVADISGNNNWGEVIGGENISWTPSSVSPAYGGAFNFSDGVNYIKIYNSSSFNWSNNYTVSIWIKAFFLDGNYATTYYLLGDNNDSSNKAWNFEIRGDGSITYSYFDSGGTGKTQTLGSAGNVIINNWYFLSFNIKRPSNITSLYINGLYKNNLTANNYSIIGNLRSLTIGSSRGTSQFFNGSIDNVIIFNRSLSSQEVSQLYKSSLTKYNQTNWNFQVNETLTNITLLNSTNTNDIFDYFLCSSNSSGSEICSSEKTITQKISNQNLNANFTTSIENIRDDFYGTQGYSYSFYSNGKVTDSSCSYNVDNDDTLVKEAFLNAGLKVLRYDMNLDQVNSDLTLSNNIIDEEEIVKWGYDNNKIINVILKKTPEWLANKTTGYCTLIGSNSSCPPTNYTKLGDVAVALIDNVTNNGLYNSSIQIELGNEVWGVSWLNNLSEDNIIKATEYVKWYNATYDAIKLKYPNIKIGAGIDYLYDTGNTHRSDNMTNTFISNLTNKWDMIYIHQYINLLGTVGFYENLTLEKALDSIYSICNDYSANCSNIIISEWNYGSSLGDSNVFTSKHSSSIANGYFTLLNNYPNNVSSIFYEFDTFATTNLSCDENWRFTMFQSYNSTYQNVYNVTSNFAHLCPAGSTVYQSSSDDNTIKTVTCKDGNKYNIIIINTDTVSKNVSKSATGFSGTKAYQMDISNGNLYLNNETNNLGIMDSYEIKYLGTPTWKVTESGLTKTSPTGVEFTSQEMNITVSNSSTVHIANYLALSEDVNVILTGIDCGSMNYLSYTPKGGTKIEWKGANAQNICTQLTTTGYTVTLNPSNDSNVFDFENICSTMVKTSYKLIMIFASLLLFSFCAYFVWNSYQDGDLTVGKLIVFFVMIIVCVGLWLASGQSLGASCGVVG